MCRTHNFFKGYSWVHLIFSFVLLSLSTYHAAGQRSTPSRSEKTERPIPSYIKREVPEAKGTIKGFVFDREGKPAAGVQVALCDEGTGIPIARDSYIPFTFSIMLGTFTDKLEHRTTDDNGAFAFEHIPIGRYRLVAQTWKDADSVKSLLDVNGEEIALFGVADNIRLTTGSVVTMRISPSGNGILRIDEDAPNDDIYMVISTAPPRADPILGFAAWGGEFMKNMIGGNRMPAGRSTIYGLPEGTVYISLFANDNKPGFASGKVDIKSGSMTSVYLPIVAAWSNAKHDPPPELAELVQELKSLDIEKEKELSSVLEELYSKAPEGFEGVNLVIGPYLDRTVELSTGRRARFAEVFAAMKYIELQEKMSTRKRTSSKR